MGGLRESHSIGKWHLSSASAFSDTGLLCHPSHACGTSRAWSRGLCCAQGNLNVEGRSPRVCTCAVYREQHFCDNNSSSDWSIYLKNCPMERYKECYRWLSGPQKRSRQRQVDVDLNQIRKRGETI